MTGPLVSVVIPTYNRVDMVQLAIQSVLNQTFEDFEVIVVDDASTDQTSEVIPDINDDRLTYIRHEENKHGAAARNTGIKHATGEYVAFLDDDDEWYPKKLKRQVTCFEKASDNVALVYTWADVYDGDKRVNKRCPELRGNIFSETLVRNPLGNTSTFMIKTSVLEDVGGFDEKLKRGQDSDLVRRIAYRYHVEYIPKILVKHRWKHDGKQITDDIQDHLYASIECREATLEKFDKYLRRDPSTLAHLYAILARQYGSVRDWPQCGKYALRALYTSPLSQKVWSEFRRLISGLRLIKRQRRITS